jgi:hypothetical protein
MNLFITRLNCVFWAVGLLAVYSFVVPVAWVCAVWDITIDWWDAVTLRWIEEMHRIGHEGKEQEQG